MCGICWRCNLFNMSNHDDILRDIFSHESDKSNFNSSDSPINDKINDEKSITEEEEEEEQTKIPPSFIEIAIENIETLFKDQYSEGFGTIFVKDHYEVTSLSSTRFKRFLFKLYYDMCGKPANPESINKVVNTLQAKAEFGDIQYLLSLRVAEYTGDLYYDLTNEKHQSIKISQKGTWEIINKTPIPLFKRYNQIPQTLPSIVVVVDPVSEDQDTLENFFSKLTNIKDKEDKLIAKVALITWFIPNIPHFILIVHGGKGSAKSTFLSMIKSIIDPAKPSLFTIHDEKQEFIQQIAHNYMSIYDNLKYNPKWLSDEVCKAITGIGQTKRVLFTVEDDKVFEYKHCLLFNGINVAFSEPDVIDRSISIELSEIKPENRKTEKE